MLLNRKSRERKKQDVFLVEGLKMFREAPKDRLVKTYLSESFYNETVQKHTDLLQGIEYEVVKDSVFSQMSDTLTPQGILTIVRQFHYSLEQLEMKEGMGSKENTPIYLILEDLQDPGNVGTLLRSAEAFGATGAILLSGTATPWSSKSLRASAGSALRLPLVAMRHAGEAALLLRRHGIRSYAAVPSGGSAVQKAPLEHATALWIGNEGAGLSEKELLVCDGRLTLSMAGPTESLNAAVAGSLLLYEASQRRALAPLKPSVKRGEPTPV